MIAAGAGARRGGGAWSPGLARARGGRQRPLPQGAARPDRRRVQGPSRARALEGRRRAGARARAGLPDVSRSTALRARSTRSPGRAHRGAEGPGAAPGEHRHAADGGGAQAVRACLRHPRRRHLPVSKPPGAHAGGPPVDTDISVVGDMTRLIARATGRKGDLDDPADRLERRLPAAPDHLPDARASAVHGLRRGRGRSARAVLLRRSSPAGDGRSGQASSAGTGPTGTAFCVRSSRS